MKKIIALMLILTVMPAIAADTAKDKLLTEARALGFVDLLTEVKAPALGIAAPANTDSYEYGVIIFNTYINSKKPGIKNQRNLPFILTHGTKTKNVALMMHGFSDSPYYMRELGRILFEQGYNVICLLTPGHGTKPENLTTVTTQQWRDEVDYGLTIAAMLGENISMAGFSTGAAQSLDAIHRHPELKVAKLFLFSPAIQIHKDSRLKAELGCKVQPVVAMYNGQFVQAADTPEISPYAYTKKALNGVCRVQDFIEDNDDNLDSIKERLSSGTKIFAVESLADKTVDPDAVTKFMNSLQNTQDNVYVQYPAEKNIRHNAVTRPETNPLFHQLHLKLAEFAALQ